ncbi:MAG: hypothetical protein ACT4PZ_21045 [Panacagrimonas sp.]
MRAFALGLMLLTLQIFGGSGVQAHGGVSMEDDNCIMRIGKFRAHFTGYQPELRATQEFCEDIPELGKAIIVVDFIENPMRTKSVEFRVLRDAKDLGKSARFDDLGGAGEIDAATLVKLDAQTYPKGTLTFETRFEQPGWYIGMLSATDPANGETLHSVFPFRVGVKNYWSYVPAFVLVIGLSWLAYKLTGRNLKKAPAEISDA